MTEANGIEWGSVAQIASAAATFLAVLVALFKDEFLRRRRSPKLKVRARLTQPDCHKTSVTRTIADRHGNQELIDAECYYLRLWIENVGKTRAERVQVFAAELWRKEEKQFTRVDTFLPMSLRWAHSPDPRKPEVYADGISPLMGRHCDLARIIDPTKRPDFEPTPDWVTSLEPALSFDVEVPPNTLTHIAPPGVYRLRLRTAAANCSPVDVTVEICLKEWSSDEQTMFAELLALRVVK